MSSTESIMSKLFRWKTSAEYNGVTFYIRVVGDSVIEDARRLSLLESRKMRKALRDVNSDEYLIHLDMINDLSTDEVIDAVVALGAREAMREYLQWTPRPIIEPLGDYPSQEEQEEHESAKSQREEQYIEDMQLYIENWSNDYKTALQAKPREFVENIFRRYRVNRVCEDIYSDFFERCVLAASVYSDEQYKKRMFTFAEFNDLPTEVRAFVRDTYEKLTTSTEDIKN